MEIEDDFEFLQNLYAQKLQIMEQESDEVFTRFFPNSNVYFNEMELRKRRLFNKFEPNPEESELLDREIKY